MTVDIATLAIRIDSLEARNAARDMDRMRDAGGRAEQATSGLETATRKLQGALALLGLGAGVGAIIRMADEYTKFTAQLRLATESQRQYATAMEDVRRIANTAQQDLAATGVLYARIANGTRELGVTQKQVAAITETVNLALKVSGATAAESSSAMLQLSQSFASGTLRGEEFNAVNEAAPRLMKALADGIGVPVGALKKMAEEGAITSKIMADVLPNALLKLQEEAKQVQTISGAFTVLKNNIMEFTGVQAQASGTVSVLTSAIGALADNLTLLAGITGTMIAVKLGTWLAGITTSTLASVTATRALAAANLATAQSDVAAAVAANSLAQARVLELRAAVMAAEGNVALAITTNGLIPAELRAIQTTTALAAANGTLTVATTAASASATVLKGALAFLGGPIGAIITVLGLGATAWAIWGDKGAEAEKKVTATLAEEIDEYIANLDKQIAKLKERNELAEKKMVTGAEPVTEGEKKREAILAEINRISKDTDLNITTRTQVLAVWGGKLNQVTQDLERFNTEQKKNSDFTRNDRLAKWYGENGTSAQRLAAELEKLKKQFGEIPPEMEKMVRAKFADKGAAAAVKQEQTAYQQLMTTIEEKIAANKLEMNGYNQLSESQKLTIKLDAEIATGKTKLSASDIAHARTMIAVVATTDAVIASNKRAADGLAAFTALQKSHDDQVAKSIQSANDEATKNEQLVVTFGMSKSAIEQMELARLQDQLAQRASTGMTLDEIAALEALIAAKQRNVNAVTQLDSLDASSSVTQAKELLDILVAVDNAAKSAAQGMADSFGRVGSAIGGLTTALTGYAVQQQAVAAQLAAVKADPKSSAQKIAQAEISASKASAQAQIKSYGDMAGAAKSFFKENTAGYKVLQTTEKAFRAYEMAMAIESMVTRLFATNTVTTAVVAGKAFESTAMIGAAAVDTATTGVAVANSATKATASTVAGVAKAFEQMGVYGFIGAAAIIAFMASMGSTASGGGGGVDVAKERQKAAGAGSVLGDESAKSDSIGRSIENLEKYASVELSHTRDMLSALVKIRDTIGVVAAMASQTAGLRATALDEKKYGVGSSSGVLGIGASSTTIQDSGIKLNGSQTIGSAIASGVDATGYADILKKKSGFFGIGSSSKTSRDVIQLDDDLKKQFGLLVGSMRDGAVEAVKVLGVSTDGIVEKINGMALGIDEISFKGLTGEEIEEQLQAVFSKVGDDIAKLAAPELTRFQQVGEGYLETLTRIATNYATLDSIMESSGVSFGAVGLSSIAARENLIKLTGGLDALISSTESFNDNFLTEAERLVPVQKYVTDQLAAMGLQSLDTRDKFKEYVLGLTKSGALLNTTGDITTRSQQQYAALLALSDAFAKTHLATVDLTKSEQEIADERKDLQTKYDELTLSSAQLREKERATIAASNLALYDSIIALEAQKDAAQALADQATALLGEVDSAFTVLQRVVEREKAAKAEAHAAEMKALQVRIDASTSSIAKLKSLSDTLKSSLDSMTVSGTGDSDARTVGQAQIQAALAIVKAGGPLPSADSLKQALSSVTKDASDQFATYDDYLTDFYKTQNDIAALGKVSDAALSVEQKTLDLLQAQKDASQTAYDAEVARLNEIVETARSQIDVLKGMDTSLLTIDQTLQAVLGAIMKAQANSSISSNAAIVKSYQENLGRNPDKAGLEFYQQQAAAGTSIGSIDASIKNSGEAQIQSLYKNLLGRNADAGGLKYWLDSLNSGASLANIEAAIKLDAEYKKLHPLAVGTNYVPRDMPALIHEGERVIPKADNVELMNRLRSPATDNNAELLAELRAQRQENAEMRGMLESHLYAIAKNTLNTSDTLEAAAVGDVPLATKEIA